MLMAAANSQQVAAAFGSARNYSVNAGIQRIVAAELAERIAAVELPSAPRILEIGCGTGFLTQQLLERGVVGEWLITDKSPGMVQRCRDVVGAAPGRAFAVLDGEYGMGDHTGEYDLICASMAMQWFGDLGAATGRLVQKLAPGGHLLFNTLASGTFKEWRAAHFASGQGDGAIAFPSVSVLQGVMTQFAPAAFTVSAHQEAHRDAREFMTRLKLIGAATARSDHRPLGPGALKQVMARFDAEGAAVTYEVVTCHIVRGDA